MSAGKDSPSSEGFGIWSSFVKFQGRSGEYVLGLDASGIKAAPAEKDGKAPPGLLPFSLAWSEISSAEQRFGYFHWGMVFHLHGSAEPCEVWLLYEHFTPAAFHQIAQKFSDRISFRAAAGLNWKIVAVPLGFALFWGVLGAWAFRTGHDWGAFVLGLAGFLCVVYAVWLFRRSR
jgi:hypothetical protein